MERMERRMKKMILAGIGAAALAREESNGLIHDLIQKGESVVERSGIAPHQKVHDITREQRQGLLRVLKHFSVPVDGPCPVEQAIVTSGGVKVGEIDPKTMESKIVKGLYFAGELIDVDAYTGGFNLQIAWATGRAAGRAAAGTEECEGSGKQ